MAFIISKFRRTLPRRAPTRFALACRWVTHAQHPPINFKTVKHFAQRDAIEVEWTDGFRALFLKKWLRENCTCEMCLHAVTKQRFIDTASVSDDSPMVATSIMKDDPKVLQIQWQHSVVGDV